jgi:inorganic pyrophosphatase
MNLWHDLKPGSLEAITTVVEIPHGSKNKYEIDKETGLIALDRVLHSAQEYPFNYGFVPQTLWDDNDALDVIILATHPIPAGILVRVRAVAIMNMMDSGEADDKIIAVPIDDPRWAKVNDLGDVNPHTLKEMEHFFATYKQLQNKEVKVTGFKGRAEALAAFTRAQKLYNEKYPV